MSKKLAILFGVVFVIVGILGFIPNPIVGMNGFFMTNHLHDAVHFIFGVILLIVAYAAPARSALWMIILGVVYLILAVLGFLTIPNGGMLLGLVTMNMSDHWLHVVLGIVLIIAGVATKRPMSSMPPSRPMAA